MNDKVASKIKKVSNLKYDAALAEEPFEWWGPSPEEARRVMSAKSKGMHDKRTTLKEAVAKYVKDGINIGIGGFVNTRVPVAIVHEIIRKGAKDLTLSFQSNSICAELLAGAMILDPDHVSIKRVELAWWGYEVIGIAPLLRYLTSRGMIRLDDYTNYGMSARFKAAAMGVPFIPTRDHGGSDMELVNRGKMVVCPFSGKNVYLVPACHPDVAIVHVTAADMYGNCRIFGAHCTCPEITMAATYSIVTTERIIPNENVRTYPNLTEIPYAAVDALVEQPFGAYPGASYGFYWFDMEHILKFRSLCEEFRRTGNKDNLKRYYDEYIFGCDTFDDFLGRLPYKTLRKIKDMDGGQPIILS
ncbi:MAG TPA: CoA transferase [Syntrophales bacterium]|nr:CoA transferase [Syntrophales bacterium]HOM06230.1 CoA transferase [Syntrophales bacterium]HON99330.1 CoA transferase [Syntrophales bacterium]HPC00155.1 CoA transferase [Syntrophales bacterium]HPQ05788.1 CoA transferase [Syntrophales bacterium]